MNDISMNFTSFTQTILKNLQEKLGENYMVFSHSVKKNNGIELTGIIVRRKGYNASPAIYIDNLYRMGITKEEVRRIADRLYDDFQAAEFEDNLDLSGFAEFKTAKRRLTFKLVNAEKNRELLKLIPHKLFHNLALVFYYTVQEPPFYGNGTILVYNNHMRQWGIEVEELFQTAFINAQVLFPGVIESMQDIMRGVLEDGISEDILFYKETENEEPELFGESRAKEPTDRMMAETGKLQIPMYVLTNRQKLYGAACMLYPGVLKAFAEKKRQDFYVLPSSVHEVILVPAGIDADRETLRGIVTEINRTQVAEEEILADSVYFYSRSRDKILWLL